MRASERELEIERDGDREEFVTRPVNNMADMLIGGLSVPPSDAGNRRQREKCGKRGKGASLDQAKTDRHVLRLAFCYKAAAIYVKYAILLISACISNLHIYFLFEYRRCRGNVFISLPFNLIVCCRPSSLTQ